MMIRENTEKYMRELKAWLAETADSELEEMGAFFTRRLEGYEEHMSVWKKAYQRFAQLLPDWCGEILDLGCGTGLELGEIWSRKPELSVTGVDLCQAMLGKLQEQYGDKPFHAVCEDYFRYDMGEERWDGIISFESLHHFLPEKKQELYAKVHKGLKSRGVFLIGDYIACCQEEEEILRAAYLEKRKKSQESMQEDTYVHFDIPLTLEHEKKLLEKAGFSKVSVFGCIDGATLLAAEK